MKTAVSVSRASADTATGRTPTLTPIARSTSCPGHVVVPCGHILLFGHVKILILSLLSKSLPIKGREARLAAKAEGQASCRAPPGPATPRRAAAHLTGQNLSLS